MLSSVYLWIPFKNYLVQKVLKMVPLMATGPEVYDATTTTVLSNLYDDLGETLNHLKSLKLMSYPGGDVSAYCDVILVDDE